MRAWSIALVLALAGLLLWLTVAWVPADGSLFAWQPAAGKLLVPSQGISLLPRWTYRRQPAATLTAEVAAASREGKKVAVTVRWRPSPGTYELTPAEDPQTALGNSTAEPVRQTLAAIALGCLAPGTVPATGCPADAALPVAKAVASTVADLPERFAVTYTPDPAGVRELLLASFAAGLQPAERQVLVLGLDGLDWDLVLPWVRSGDMPHLEGLMKSGTWGRMETIVPTLSPLIWTSIATGVTPDVHGILDFVEKEGRRGLMVPVTGRGRRVPALWNLASALHRTVGVVGWWATWPAERVRGVMVSDRLYYTLTQGLSPGVLRNDPPELVFPTERSAALIELRDRAVRETDWQALRYFMDVPESRFDRAVADRLGMDDPVDGFRRILAATRTYLGAGLELAAATAGGSRPDLLMVYLEGTDTIGHLLAPYMPPPTLAADPAEAAVVVAAVPKYFQIVDRWIGRFLEHYPLAEAAVLVVSDHGFKWSDNRPRGVSGTAGPTAPLWHETDAVFVVAGAGIEHRGEIAEPASIYDVAPTVAALLGLPADVSWNGSVLPGCPPPTLAPVDYLPLVPPESYRQTDGGEAPVDPEQIAKLRALGYIGGGSGPTTAPSSSPLPPPASATSPGLGSTATRGQLNNLAVVKINAEEYEEAERLLRRAIAMSPEYPSPHYNLRRIFMETGRYADADRELWIAVDKGLRDPQRSIDQAAKDYDDLDQQPRTVTLLTEALKRFPGHEPFWVHLLVVRIRLDQCAAGVETGKKAATRFPDSAPVHAFYGLAAGCTGDVATARDALRRSLELNPRQPSLRRTLAELSGVG
ncbi:MAG: alkaline phosphatase family protein [Thermoanaerobaculia bacterium]